MGEEYVGAHSRGTAGDVPLVPPGFIPVTSFNLKRIHKDATMNWTASSDASNFQPTKMDNESSMNGLNVMRSRRRRPWINYRQFDSSSDEELELEPLKQESSSVCCLPKGVQRGCPECPNCQKVTARWRPRDTCRPILNEAPVFYPSEEDFKDTLKYIRSIHHLAEPYGICRIIPPSSWNPPCPLKEKNKWENDKFATRIQRVDKLQNRSSVKRVCKSFNGLSKKKRYSKTRMDYVTCNEDNNVANAFGYSNISERFGFEPGSEFTLEAFQKYADDFKEQYFCLNDSCIDLKSNHDDFRKRLVPTVEDIEGEYWRMVEKPTEEIEVLYGADIETRLFGSGFPKAMPEKIGSDLEDQYVRSGWNLNNLSRLPGSVLSFESGDISGVQVPWLYVGMCFSSFCWHVEDHHFYSLNYMHWGAQKVWYGVPGKYAMKFEAAMKKHLPDLFEEQPDLLHKLVTQLSPSILKSVGIPVYRCVQHPKEFVLTFPRAYHSGFNCGFNCAEAVNVAPIDWLPHGQSAVERYREQQRKTTVSHDKLLLGAAKEAVRALWELSLLRKNTSENSRWKEVCGEDGILTRALKVRVEMERMRREFLSSPSQSRKMVDTFDATCERECSICLYDLHLSASGCEHCPDKYACLNHAKQLCSCSWNSRFFLFRYDISQLNILVDALGEKLSAIYRGANLFLGLCLSSYVNKDKTKTSLHYTSGLTSGVGQTKPVIATDSSGFIDCPGTFHESKGLVLQPSDLKEHADNEKEQIIRETSSFRVDMDEMPSSFQRLNMPVDGRHIRGRGSSEIVDRDESSFSLNHKSKKACLLKVSNDINLSNEKCQPVSEALSFEATQKSIPMDEDLAPEICKNNSTSFNDQKGQAMDASERVASKLSERDCKLPSVIEKGNHLIHSIGVQANVSGEGEKCMEYQNGDKLEKSFPQTLSCNNSQPRGFDKSNSHFDGKDGMPISHYSMKRIDGMQSISENPCKIHDIERYYCQKGPQMAKVVQRINCTVELVNLGVVLSGGLWSNHEAIFPKGFKSRVRYLSVLDPTKMCNYTSEILDAGLYRPLFMVKLEQCPSEVFIHLSAVKCWDMVRERVNNEIKKQYSLDRTSLPPLQPPGSLDGLEMFGFFSPAIIQAIEMMDRDHICTGYWNSRSAAGASTQVSQKHPLHGGSSTDDPMPAAVEEAVPKGTVRKILSGLLKKANLEELHYLHSFLVCEGQSFDPGNIIQLLNEEIRGKKC